MFSFEWVPRHVMVERAQFPGTHIVAIVAPFIKGWFVGVLVTVVTAGKGNPFPFFLFVAFVACYLLVSAF